MRVAWGEVVPSAPLSCPPLSLWVWGRALRGLPAPALLIAVRVVGAPAEPRMRPPFPALVRRRPRPWPWVRLQLRELQLRLSFHRGQGRPWGLSCETDLFSGTAGSSWGWCLGPPPGGLPCFLPAPPPPPRPSPPAFSGRSWPGARHTLSPFPCPDALTAVASHVTRTRTRPGAWAIRSVC